MTLFNKSLQQSFILYMVLQNGQPGLSLGISKIISFLDFLHNLRSDDSFTKFLLLLLMYLESRKNFGFEL